MKKSKYNHLSRRIGYTVLYNSATDLIAQLDTQLADIYENSSPEEIHRIHPDFYEFLLKNRFFVDDGLDEVQAVIDEWIAADKASDELTIAINPTLNCNLHCWYCYENHSGKKMMDKQTYEKLISYIKSVFNNSEKRRIHIGFFGGEPLLNFNTIAKPLMLEALRLSGDTNKTISYSFVTNGTLANEEFANFIREIGVSTKLQITFDGNRETHDSVRNTANHDGTYDTILANCIRLLDIPNVSLIMRCNYTSANILSFLDLASNLKKINKGSFRNIDVDLHQVWQDKSPVLSTNISNQEEFVRKAFTEAGLSVSAPKSISKYRCYADTGNSVLINYNGDVYRCTARDFRPENREGVLTVKGNIQMNERSDMRDSLRWGTLACKSCVIYPICHGGCSQNIIENQGNSSCYFKHDKLAIHQIIENRLSYLLTKQSN